MSRYAKGRDRENWLLQEIKDDPDCLEAVRSSRSLGSYDICAIMKEETWLIQVKTMNGVRPEDRRCLECLSASMLYRTVWVVEIGRNEVRWQMYLDSENGINKPAGWYYYPDGPFGQMGTRVKTR